MERNNRIGSLLRRANDRISGLDRKRLALITALMLLMLAVRIYYYSGPVFANTQDEAIYINIFANAVFHNALPDFSVYRNANFSDATSGVFDPVVSFAFYSGFIYPEILIQKLLGFSVDNAIYYVILMSLVQSFFLFLILERMAGRRAGIIGVVLLAFLPDDVLFSTHVQPLIPMEAMLSVALYLITLSFYEKSGKKASKYYLMSGFFASLGYLANPLGLSLMLILAVYSIAAILLFSGQREARIRNFVLLTAGFMIGFSIMGVYYLYTAGNYLLALQVLHNVFLFQLATQHAVTANVTGFLRLQYMTGSIGYYLPLLTRISPDRSIPVIRDTLDYFAIMVYLSILFGALAIFRKRRHSMFFAGLLVADFLIIWMLPVNASLSNNSLLLEITSQRPYYTTLLALPAMVITALGIDELMRMDRGKLRYAAYAVIMLALYFDIIALNWDIGFYRASVATIHDLAAYAEMHPSQRIYVNGFFGNEVQDLLAYRYNVTPTLECNSSFVRSIRGDYVAVGGSIDFSLSPAGLQSFDDCMERNLTDATMVGQFGNPMVQYEGTFETPPLTIYRVN